jgi:ATPases involved in chromosome partitioning
LTNWSRKRPDGYPGVCILRSRYDIHCGYSISQNISPLECSKYYVLLTLIITKITLVIITMIITLGGIKGGSGKTTMATNLAIMRARDGHDVLLVDADAQETATDFTYLRAQKFDGNPGYTAVRLAGRDVATQLIRMESKFNDVIIDTAGRDSQGIRAAMAVSDLVLVPFVPRAFDVWTLEETANVVSEMAQANRRLKGYTFINRADPRGHDNSEAADYLKEQATSLAHIPIMIGSRKAFANAAREGLAVIELKAQDPKALEEITALYQAVFVQGNL